MGVGEWRGGGWYFGSPVGNKQEGKASMLKPPPQQQQSPFMTSPWPRLMLIFTESLLTVSLVPIRALLHLIADYRGRDPHLIVGWVQMSR